MSWKTVQLNCREFKCVNNKNGGCLLEKVTLQTDENPIIGKLKCTEAVWSEETKSKEEK